MSAHLWEAEHPYHCSENNYFSSECAAEFRSWDTFLEEEGDCDFDLNLLVRWDWDKKDRTLTLYWVGQRKGLFRSTTILGMHADDEPSVREWLMKRWDYLRKIWEPFSDAGRAALKEGDK